MELAVVTKVPPEGNWGYMVAIANVLVFIIIVCPLQSFGLIYGDFFESLGGRTSNIALTLGIFNFFFSITGLFVNKLFKSLSCRQICMVGATAYAVSNVSLIFVSSLAHVLVTYSIIGTAVGLMMPAIITSFNEYFLKKRLKIFFVTKLLISIATTCFPLLVHGLRELYGFHGMLAVICGINMHGILAAILLQPVKRYLKDEVTIKTEDTLNLKQIINKCDDMYEEDCITMEPLLNGERQANTTKLNDTKTVHSDEKIMTSLKSKPKLKDENKSTTKIGLWQAVNNVLNLSLLKDLRYVNMLIGISISEGSCQMFTALLPIYLEKIAWSKADISFCISGIGLADLASITILAISASYRKAKSRHIYLVGVVVTLIARFVFIFLEAYTPVFIVLSVIWFFRTWMLASYPMVFAEHFTPQRFPAAYGLYMFVQGINSLSVNVAAGYIRDVTGSYPMCFYFLMFCLLICAIPWTIEILWIKIKKPQIE